MVGQQGGQAGRQQGPEIIVPVLHCFPTVCLIQIVAIGTGILLFIYCILYSPIADIAILCQIVQEDDQRRPEDLVSLVQTPADPQAIAKHRQEIIHNIAILFKITIIIIRCYKKLEPLNY